MKINLPKLLALMTIVALFMAANPAPAKAKTVIVKTKIIVKKPIKKPLKKPAKKKPAPAAKKTTVENKPLVFTEVPATADLFLLRGKQDFEIGKFSRIYARIKIPPHTIISEATLWKVELRYPKAKTGEIEPVVKTIWPAWISPDKKVAEFLIYSNSGSEEFIAPQTFISDLLDGPYARDKMRVSFSVTLDNSPKPLSDASFSVFKPLSRSSIITTDDKALKMELPMDSPWLLQSKTLEKIVLGYGGLYEEYPPTFTIYINQVPENSDPHAAEVEYIRTLEDQKRLEVGSDYFPISKASILANTDPIQFKFNFAIDDPQTGLKRQDYRNWKGYVIYKNGIVYCLIGEAYDMLKFEDQFDALAALVKIK